MMWVLGRRALRSAFQQGWQSCICRASVCFVWGWRCCGCGWRCGQGPALRVSCRWLRMVARHSTAILLGCHGHGVRSLLQCTCSPICGCMCLLEATACYKPVASLPPLVIPVMTAGCGTALLHSLPCGQVAAGFARGLSECLRTPPSEHAGMLNGDLRHLALALRHLLFGGAQATAGTPQLQLLTKKKLCVGLHAVGSTTRRCG